MARFRLKENINSGVSYLVCDSMFPGDIRVVLDRRTALAVGFDIPVFSAGEIDALSEISGALIQGYELKREFGEVWLNLILD